MDKVRLKELIQGYSSEKLQSLLYAVNFEATPKDLTSTLPKQDIFKSASHLGELHTDDKKRVLVVEISTSTDLSERSSRKKQFDLSKKILQTHPQASAGLFVYYDTQGRFRFSLVYPIFKGTRRQYSTFRRYSFFVSSKLTNRTFLERVGGGDFTTLKGIKEAFSLVAVTNDFYKQFQPTFDVLVDSVVDSYGSPVKGKNTSATKDFALLFVIRSIFVGFIQKRKWIGDNEMFLQDYWATYNKLGLTKDTFYTRWLKPLFFEALNKPVGHKVAYGNNDFPSDTEQQLQMAPYLNGGTFAIKRGVDDQGFSIPDSAIEQFFDFIFSHNFTIEENTLNDEDLELNPEFLGIIFERLVNKDQGAVYTPRTEVDFMCRISLVKWLEKKMGKDVTVAELYRLCFPEMGEEAMQTSGSFTATERHEILRLLENVTICDPAVGSGAFPVGMLHVLDEVEQQLRSDLGDLTDSKSAYERKKRIIGTSLYGVEVKEWAVWITQLRLWITLFIDAPEELRTSQAPLLPTLDFHIRQGDSLVQKVGNTLFQVRSTVNLQTGTTRLMKNLIQYKQEVFENKRHGEDYHEKEVNLFRQILEDQILAKDKERRELVAGESILQAQLFSTEGTAETRQGQLDLFKEKEETLAREIQELEEQKKRLSDNRPLVWRIEFAEIFAGDDPGFDIIIGNPPYVRQEAIVDPSSTGVAPALYKDMLEKMVRADFPQSFTTKDKVDRKSDLYTYFYIRGLRLLNAQGVLTYICSNSWLDVGYGAWLQRFLLETRAVDTVYDNHAERSFEAADVNTIINVLHSPRARCEVGGVVRFVAFKKPFEEVIHTDNMLVVANAQALHTQEDMRIFPVNAKQLFDDSVDMSNGKLKYIGDKWGGKYLRAPDIFFTILEKGKGKLVKLKDVAEVRFGIKTGANEFFYLTKDRAKQLGIEQEFLRPVIKSPRECKSIVVNPADLQYVVFLCNKSKEELRGTKALEYIEWGEREKVEIRAGANKGKFVTGYHKLESNNSRLHWWDLGVRTIVDLHFNYLVNEIGHTFYSPTFASDNFHDISIPSGYTLSLNSIVFALMQNVYGRANFGGGLMKIQTYELKQFMIPDIQVDLNVMQCLMHSTQSIFKACGIDPTSDVPISEQEPNPLPDRAMIDNVVFDALELTEDERKEVYRAVCQLVWNRLSRANSR